MVERKVKLMSVQASPVAKKITMVLAMALGCDQKKASIQPVRAPISHSESAPTRMPICTVTSAQVGQSFCTGRRRTGFRLAGGAADCLRRQIEARQCVHGAGVLNRHRLLPATAQAAWFMVAIGAALALRSSRQRSLMTRNSGVSALVRTRGRGSVTGMLAMTRPGRVPMTCTSSER